MKTIEHIYDSTLETNGEWQPFTEPEYKDEVTPIIEKHAANLDARIREALAETNASFSEVKERYQEQDWSNVSEEIWAALNEIDDSPVGQLVHGVVYGINEKVVELLSIIYDKAAERFGETLTTTINDQAAYDRLLDPLIKEAYADLYEAFFEAYDEHGWTEHDPTEQQPPREYYEQYEPEKLEQFDEANTNFDFPNELPPALVGNSPDKPLSPLGGESLKDYLEAIPPDYSEYIEAGKGLER